MRRAAVVDGEARDALVHYEFLGRIVESDLAMPLSSCAPSEAAIVIRRVKGIASGGDLVHQNVAADGETVYSCRLRSDSYVWEYPRTGSFEISRDGSRICWLAPPACERDAAVLLAGPILGLALQLQGCGALHGNALVRRGSAFGLLAPSGHGKSTLAAALMRAGCELLSDDFLALDLSGADPVALPGRPRLKLWPDSLECFLPEANWPAFDRHVSWVEKRLVSPEQLGAYSPEGRPIAALFVLVPVAPESSLKVERLRGSDAIVALLANVYHARLLSREPDILSGQLETMSRVASRLPVYAIACPRSFERLEETAGAVLGQLQALGC
jgi:hypothetical protein